MTINPQIFRAYDIRGRADGDLSEEIYYLLGKAFGSTLRELYGLEHPRVALGRDMRTHGVGFEKATMEGLLSSGCEVLMIGETPSPVNYFVICERKLDGGLQITASHNPKEDNGLKLQIRDAAAFAGEDIQKLRQRIEEGRFVEGEGRVETIDGLGEYLNWLQGNFSEAGKGMTVAFDAGNGMEGPAGTEIFKRVGAKATGLYTTPDGTFPNHAADPSKFETLRELQALVVSSKASIGFAFDGDGDRLGIVDERGTIRTCDEVLLLLAQDYLKRFPGTPVVFTVSMSSTLETEILKWGGKPVMCEVGHSFVEHVMRKTGAMLGGEQSGHFFLEDVAHGYDDALIVALQILDILRRSGTPLSALCADFPKVFLAHERRPACPDDKKIDVVRRATEYFKQSYPVNTIDGARIDFGGGAWASIRYSNTSPKLSICIEARSEDKLKSVEELVLGHLRTYPDISW